MDLFAHVLAAGLVAEGVARAPESLRRRRVPVYIAAFFLGSFSHLALDALPHFGFLPSLLVWTWMPHAWLVRPIVGGTVALAFILHGAGKNRAVALAACAGAIYPDVEKVLHREWGWPLVLFRRHAEVATTFTAGLSIRALAAAEIALAAIFVVAYLKLSARREKEP